MFQQRLASGGVIFLLGAAGILWTASPGQAQVFNTITVDTPRGFSFYTFPANYAPYFVPGYGVEAYGFGPAFYPRGNFSTTFNLLPPSRSPAPASPKTGGTPRAAAGSPKTTNAAIELYVPADAKVWIQGERMKQTGTVRRFVSPPLDPALAYTYDLRVSWTEEGREVSHDQHLAVRASDRQSVSFPAALAARTNAAPKVASK